MLRSTTARTLVGASRPRVCLPSVVGSRAGSHDAHPSPDGEHYPEEGFNARFWQYGSFAVIGALIAYRLTPDNANPHLASGDDKPYMTRFIEKNIMPAEGLWKARNEKHLELSKVQAEDKLLFQEAERPKVRRLRYLGTFEQASPHGLSTGTQANLSDLVIKSEKDDFKADQ